MIWNDSFAYKLLLFLHLLSVVIGFGGYMLNGLFGRQAAKQTDEGGKAINGAFLQVSKVSQYAMYGVLIFGIGLIGAAKKGAGLSFSTPWVGPAILVWVLMVGVLHGLILPAQTKLAGGDGDRASLTQRLSMSIGIMNLLLVVALVLMVWEPGTKGI